MSARQRNLRQLSVLHGGYILNLASQYLKLILHVLEFVLDVPLSPLHLNASIPLPRFHSPAGHWCIPETVRLIVLAILHEDSCE